MIENFRIYINTLLCLGIFITILQFIIPKNNMRKYIYSLTGIIMIITIISPLVNLLKNPNIEEGISQVISNIDSYKIENNSSDEKYKEANEKLLKEQVIDKIKIDIEKKLKDNEIEVRDISIYLEDNYDIKKISININNLNSNSKKFSNLNNIVKYITEQYCIDYSKIEVVEEGQYELS